MINPITGYLLSFSGMSPHAIGHEGTRLNHSIISLSFQVFLGGQLSTSFEPVVSLEMSPFGEIFGLKK
jgi:hypothetical protein